LQRFLAGKDVLVTGAGGSIGSEICRQSMKFCPRRMILLDQAENNLFEVDRELRHRWVGAELIPLIADICRRPPNRAHVFERYSSRRSYSTAPLTSMSR
jgi:FlaA1/EpsC-like NDP-sugar epimerase